MSSDAQRVRISRQRSNVVGDTRAVVDDRCPSPRFATAFSFVDDGDTPRFVRCLLRWALYAARTGSTLARSIGTGSVCWTS